MNGASKGSALLNLSLVLVQTCAALGLGYASVRCGFVDIRRGDLRAIHFYVAKIALPAIVFKVIATSSLGTLRWGVVLACNLSKFTVFVIVFALSYFAFKRDRNKGQRVLTSTVFSFFSVASNDFAIGIPVIDALYGKHMMAYIAANVFIFQTVVQPIVMVLLELGKALSRDGDDTVPLRCSQLLMSFIKGLATNLILIATLAGLLWQVFCQGLLVQGDDGMILPSPLYEVIAIWTQPFTMMFLFINGALLSSTSLDFWSSMLVLMKGIVCAYLGYGFAMLFVPGEELTVLQDFCFFYGSIPAGGAPLLFAEQVDPDRAPLIAAASLFCIIQSGPVELVTAMYLKSSSGGVHYVDLHRVQRDTALVGATCAGLAFLLALATWRSPSVVVGTLMVYSFAVLVYSCFTVGIPLWGCHSMMLKYLYASLQTACFLIPILLSYFHSKASYARASALSWGAVVSILAFVVPLVVTWPNQWHELCSHHATQTEYTINGAWKFILFLVTLGLPTAARCARRHEVDPDRLWTSSMVSTLAVLQAVRLLIMFIDVTIKRGDPANPVVGFTPMLIVIDVLEYGQGAIFLFLVMFCSPFGEHARQCFKALRAHGIQLEDPELLHSVCEQAEPTADIVDVDVSLGEIADPLRSHAHG